MTSTGKCTFQKYKVVKICISNYNYIIRDNYVTDSNRGPDSIVNIS